MERKILQVSISPEAAKAFKAACALNGSTMSDKAEELFRQYVREQLSKKAA